MHLALKTDGTVVAWGHNGQGRSTVPAGLGGVTAVDAGGAHNLALKADGTVVAWGNNESGQSTVPAGLSGVTAVNAGHWHSLVLKTDGTVAAWGRNGVGQTVVPAGLTGVRAIDAGGDHNLALRAPLMAIGDPYSTGEGSALTVNADRSDLGLSRRRTLTDNASAAHAT